MSRLDIAVLSLRLAALYIWFQALQYVAVNVMALLYTHFRGTTAFSVVLFSLPCVLMILAGLFLFSRASSLAHRFLPPVAVDSPPSSAVTPVLAFAIVGLFAFVYALPRVTADCLVVLHDQRFPEGKLPQMVANFVQLAGGFALFVRPHRLAAWWQRRG